MIFGTWLLSLIRRMMSADQGPPTYIFSMAIYWLAFEDVPEFISRPGTGGITSCFRSATVPQHSLQFTSFEE